MIEVWNTICSTISIALAAYGVVLVALWFFRKITILNKISTPDSKLSAVFGACLVPFDFLLGSTTAITEMNLSGFMYLIISILGIVIMTGFGLYKFVVYARSKFPEC